MSLFCKLEDLRNESDVEQKFIWPLLTSPEPTGLGYSPADIYTKANIKFLAIEKGTAEKVYRPDYIVLMAGFPLVAIEAKHPEKDLNEALREARLYAAELNSFHPPGINPCYRIVVSNGKKTLSSPSDSQEIDLEIDFQDIHLASTRYHEFLTLLKRSALHERTDALRNQFAQTDYRRPTHLLGGLTVRNEEVGYNQFGARIAIDFLHIFNPQSRVERAHIVRNAYVNSRRREHYGDEIDRVIRSTLPSPLPGSILVEDTSSPSEIIQALRRVRELHHKMFLLVGPVGSGKSTFVDYFREVKLPEDVRKVTVWVSVDMNDAPARREMLDDWVLQEIIRNLHNVQPDVDFDKYENIEKVFAVELASLRKGALARTPKNSQKYIDTISDEMRRLMSDRVQHTKAFARYLCNERGKLLVLVLDNCDKGNRAEQLAMFQTVRWIQSWLKCLVFLPIRDVTYHTSKDQPPLDTVIKDFVFRIETPPFTEVLNRRIKLAFTELMMQSAKSEKYEYSLDSGMRIIYPATELGLYLACIFKSLYDHDRLLRRMLVGLAGKNIRRAMEIFLDFCKSGHIGEKEYLKIRMNKGNYTLPYHLVTRVLLRLNRRFYDGDSSHVKNLFQCNVDDAKPDHFTRLAILLWLNHHFHNAGPTGIRGFHRCDRLVAELIPYLEGSEFSVIRDKREMKVDDAIGFPVLAGDIIQTGKKTFMELSLTQKKAIVRVSENTTLEFKVPATPSDTNLAVLYGRIRAKLSKLAGQDSFSIRNAGTVAGVRGTDFGMDVLVPKVANGSQTNVVVYCFEGSVNVQAAPAEGSDVQRTADIGAGHMVESVVQQGTVELVSAALSPEITEYWTQNEFKSPEASSIVASQPAAETQTTVAQPVAEAAPAEQAVAEAADQSLEPAVSAASAKPRMAKISWSFDKKKLALKNSILGASSLLVAAGAGLQIFEAYRYIHEGKQDDAGTYLLAGTVCTATGFVTGIFGLLLNPDIPPKAH